MDDTEKAEENVEIENFISSKQKGANAENLASETNLIELRIVFLLQ